MRIQYRHLKVGRILAGLAIVAPNVALGAVYDFRSGAGADRFAYDSTVPAAAILPAVNTIAATSLTVADRNARHLALDNQHARDRSDLYQVNSNRGIPACLGSSIVPALVTVQTHTADGGQFHYFVVRVTNQLLLNQMIDICNGLSPQVIVKGDVATGNGGYNQDAGNGPVWSWHLTEDSLELVENTTELCDGLPTDLEGNLQYWVETVTTFCPWTTAIIAVDTDTALAGDFNIDGVVGQADFLFLEGCFTGSDNPCFAAGDGCCAPDMDEDTDIDCTDGGLFKQRWTAPGTPPTLPQCGSAIPCVSEWGLICMILMLLVSGSILMGGLQARRTGSRA